MLMACVACSSHPKATHTPNAAATNSFMATPTAAPTTNDVDAMLRAAGDQMSRHDNAAAKDHIEQVLAADPTNAYAWYNLGVIADATQRTADAVNAYDHAIESDPTFTSAMYNKAILVETKHPDTAMKIYQQIIRINSNASTTYLRLGLLQAKAGQEAAAQRNFDHAVKLDRGLLEYVPGQFRR